MQTELHQYRNHTIDTRNGQNGETGGEIIMKREKRQMLYQSVHEVIIAMME